MKASPVAAGQALLHYHLLCGCVLFAVGCATSAPEPAPTEAASPERPSVALLRQSVIDDPTNAEAHYELGNALFDLGRINEARQHYAEAVALNENHAGAHCNLGLCRRYLGDIEGAIQSYERALAIEPDDLTTLQNLTVALQAAGDMEAALPHLLHIAELKPDDVQAHSDLAKALLLTGRYTLAAEVYQRVLELDPGYAGDYYNLGLCYYHLEDWDATLSAWLAALAHDPEHPSVNKGLAVVYWRRGEYDKAWGKVVDCQRLGVPLDPAFVEGLQEDSGQVGPDG